LREKDTEKDDLVDRVQTRANSGVETIEDGPVRDIHDGHADVQDDEPHRHPSQMSLEDRQQGPGDRHSRERSPPSRVRSGSIN
jgi:hypothetical protein